MRWGLVVFMACVSVAAQSPAGALPPRGVDISARDGDRVVIEEDAYVEVVRKRQATVRAIFNQEERTLIVLMDFSKPGQFPDGSVDWVFNFYQVEGTWPLGPRWEALTTAFQFEGPRQHPRGLAFETPLGLVHLVVGGPEVSRPGDRAIAVLSYRGSSSGRRFGLPFAEAETDALREAARRGASTDTTFTLTSPPNATGKTQDQATMPPGQDISANTGDRVIIEDEARIQIVRRRQAAIRTILRPEERLLILLADYANPGHFPDGTVDLAINFYGLDGGWPLTPRWEGLTTMFEYEGDPQFPAGYVLSTPLGRVHLSQSAPHFQPEPTASTVLRFRGSSTRSQPGMSFAESEKYQLLQAAERTSTTR